MSTATELCVPVPRITHREAKYIALRLKGVERKQAALACGFSVWMARNPGAMIETPEVKEEIARLQAELVENTLNAGLVDAAEIHDYLTEAIRADMRDIRNEDGSFKPQSEWPEIWGRMMEAGDVEVETESVRSHDGEDTEGRGGWETGPAIVTKVKLKFASRVKLLELAMKHKAVDAMVSPNDKLADAVSDLAGTIGSALAEGRQRVRQKVIDVTPDDAVK